MNQPIRILGIAGSVRARSYNASLLRAIVELAPDDCRMETASIAGIPLYDGDLEESQGVPPLAAALKDRIAAADGLLLVTPEYNNSLPGAFKNAIDWLTRPSSDIPRVFGGRAIALAGATPGRAVLAFRKPPGSRCCACSAPARSLVGACSSATPPRCSTPKAGSPTRGYGIRRRSSSPASRRS